jgi:ELWxxDGT repeat protein
MFAGYRSIYKDILYFPGRDTNDADFELWQYDGNNISLVYEINPSGSSNVYYLKTDSNYLYFSATDGVHGQELWQYDAIDIPHMVYDINPGPESCGPFSFSFFNSGLYFRADDGISGSEVWRYRPVTTSVTRNNKIINKCYFNRNLHSIIIEIADIVKFKPNRIVLHNCLGQNIPFSTSEADKSINIRLKNNEPPGLIIITLEINNQIITGKVFIH